MLVADQETFNPCFNELIDSILNVLPVPAVIFDHTFIDRQTSGHLEVEDGFSLFIREKAVLHELRNKVFFGKLTELVQKPDRSGFIRKQDTKLLAFLYLPAERIGTSVFFRAHHMVKDLRCVLNCFFNDVIQYIVQIIIVKIKGSPVDF